MATNEELAQRIKAGEHGLILDLWQQVEKLVALIVTRRYLPKNGSTQIELDDLLQAGFLAMMAAIDDFDISSGFQFSTFLGHHIQNACRDVLGIKTNKQSKDPIHGVLSLSQPVSSDREDLTLGDIVQDEVLKYQYDDLIEEVDRSENCKKIFKEVNQLEPLSREVFTDKFFHGYKIGDIASKHKLKEREVNNILTRSLGKIRHSATVRIMSKQYRQDQQTNFYKKKSLEDFNTTFSSTVEDIAIRREEIWQRIMRDLKGVESMRV